MTLNYFTIFTITFRFKDTVLSLGGSKHPEDVFVEFRGRKPTVTALLKSHGFLVE